MSRFNGISDSFKFKFNGSVLKIKGATEAAKVLLKLKKYNKDQGIQVGSVTAVVALLSEYENAIKQLASVLDSI